MLLAGGAVVLAMATMVRDPRLFALREPATWGVAVGGTLGLLGVLWWWRGGRWPGAAGLALAALWAAGPALVAVQEMRFARQVAAVLESGAAGTELGPHFLVGYTDAREVAPLAARGLIGGVFVTARNASGRSAEALRDEIAGLQALRRGAGLPALFVATDQEGGAVSRLSPPLPAMPSLARFAALPAAEREAAARAHGVAQGRGWRASA